MNKDIIIGFISLVIMAVAGYIIIGTNLLSPPESDTYEIYVLWSNAYGLKSGAIVRMKGVQIGEVGKIEFSNKHQQAYVTLKLFPGQRIPEDSNITVATGIFVGEKWVAIEEGSGKVLPPGSVIEGISPYTNEDNFRGMVDQIAWIRGNIGYVQEKTDSINEIVSDEEFRAQVKGKILSIRDSTEEFNQLILKTEDNMEIFSASFQQGLIAMASQLAVTTENVRYGIRILLSGVSAQVANLEDEAVTSGDDLALTVDSLKRTSETILLSVEAITEAFDPETGMPPKVKGALLSLRKSCLSIEEGAQEILAFSEKGAEYQEDLKEIMANTNKALDRIDGTLTSVLGYVREEEKPLLKHRIAFEALLTGGKENVTADLGAYFYPTEDRDVFVFLGGTDLNKEDAKVNLQLGKEFTDSLTLRAGMIKSSFGGGLDYSFSQKYSVSLDFFDFSQHNSFIDVKGRYKLTDNVDILLGVDDLLDEREVKAGMGIKF